MMSFLARHSLLHGHGPAGPSCIDFSVEETWNCPPMPTLDYNFSQKFLTQPKPDLVVCFKRNMVIPRNLWLHMPYATRRLAYYETPNRRGSSKAFHFFTIQGRRENTQTARYQNLNNASQALHNMFDFFQVAGPRHRDNFFSEVRFFSAVASTEGLNVRIHRAIDLGKNGSEDDFLTPEYPLRFEFREFVTVEENRFYHKKFDRKTVLELFGKILVGYGVEKLYGLLQDAARDLCAKLKKDPKGFRLREDANFYRHDQVDNTPVNSRMPTLTALGGYSVRSRTATPTQSQPSPSTQVSSSSAKRCRNRSEDGNPPQGTKGLRQ
jgi:hypothetical protein